MEASRVTISDSHVVISPENEAVQKHIELVESLIERMAANSSNCKLWAITLISAMVAISGKTATWQMLLIPLILFFLLDAYYLSIERDVREGLEHFVNDLHSQQLSVKRVYHIRPKATLWQRLSRTFKAATASAATLPFYLATLLLLLFLLT